MTDMPPRHVVHCVYRFAAGGMENVLVQLINHLPRQGFRHTIIALTQADPAFVRRLERDDVRIIELNKPPGQPFPLYPRVFRLLRQLRPDVMHTCNLAALEFQPVAALAGVGRRVHAEHGWDINDLSGGNRRYRLLRRLYRPWVNQFIAVSAQLHAYLAGIIGVAEDRLHLIANGVDTEVFRPARAGDAAPEGYPFRRPGHWVIGTVGRLEPVKNQLLLAQAFVGLVGKNPPGAERLRLAIVGSGPLAGAISACVEAAGLADRLWLPGARGDIPAILRHLDCFVLPSLAEGTSCTLQEALAAELAIIASDVGGNADLLEHGRYGQLLASLDPADLADALLRVFSGNVPGAGDLRAGRDAVIQRYGLAAMVRRYEQLFQGA